MKKFSFSMLTGEPNELTRPYHDRMPLITDDVDRWLDLKQDSLVNFQALPDTAFEVRPMNPAMNRSIVKDLNLIEKV